MKNSIIKLIIAVFAMVAFTSNAQEQVQKFEGDLHLCLGFPLSIYHGGDRDLSWSFGGDLRYNIPSSKFDIGMAFDVSQNRFKNIRGKIDITDLETGDEGTIEYKAKASTDMISLMFVSDYNFQQGKKINPFVGAGLGLLIRGNADAGQIGLGAKIRGGVEIKHFLRIGVETNITQKFHNNLLFTVGYVFGGRPK